MKTIVTLAIGVAGLSLVSCQSTKKTDSCCADGAKKTDSCCDSHAKPGAKKDEHKH